jgi:pyruvate,water dikinase
MIQNLTALGVNIPDGFVVTVDAYYAYIKHNMILIKIEDIVDAIDYESIESLRRGGMEIRQSFLNGKFQKNDC